MSAADAALDGKVAHAQQQSSAAIADVRVTLEEQHAAATARAQRLEGNFADLETKIAPVDDRLSKLEGVTHALDTEFAARISRLERAAESPANTSHVAELKQQLDALTTETRGARGGSETLALVEELRGRIGATETQSGEIADRLHGVARMLSRVGTDQAEATAQTEARLHKIEMTVADVRLTQIAPPAPDHTNAIESIVARLEAIERRQADALGELQADIVRFVTDNDQRLAQMEQQGAGPIAAPGEPTDLEIQFADLRRRIEERILGVEQRGVRTLEHVADTIALLEKRFLDQDEERQTA
jgi:chromosome segregation ATPase